MEITVRDYRTAESNLLQMGQQPTVELIEFWLLAQEFEELSFAKLTSRPGVGMAEMAPFRREYRQAVQPVRARKVGNGPFTLLQCDCCEECLLICTCEPSPCTKAGEEVLAEWRPFMTSDYLRVSENGVVNRYAMVEHMVGEDISSMPWGVFQTVEEGIHRSYTVPFWSRPDPDPADTE